MLQTCFSPELWDKPLQALASSQMPCQVAVRCPHLSTTLPAQRAPSARGHAADTRASATWGSQAALGGLPPPRRLSAGSGSRAGPQLGAQTRRRLTATPGRHRLQARRRPARRQHCPPSAALLGPPGRPSARGPAGEAPAAPRASQLN